MSFPRFHWGWAIVVFFLVLTLANSLILYLAVSSNPGNLVENPYGEGLQFQRQLDARALFSSKGYSLAVVVGGEGSSIAVAVTDRQGKPVSGLTGKMKFVFPGQGSADRSCELNWSATNGNYLCNMQLPRPGLWVIQAELNEGAEALEYRESRLLTF